MSIAAKQEALGNRGDGKSIRYDAIFTRFVHIDERALNECLQAMRNERLGRKRKACGDDVLTLQMSLMLELRAYFNAGDLQRQSIRMACRCTSSSCEVAPSLSATRERSGNARKKMDGCTLRGTMCEGGGQATDSPKQRTHQAQCSSVEDDDGASQTRHLVHRRIERRLPR